MHNFFRFETQTKFIIRTVRTFFSAAEISNCTFEPKRGGQNKSAAGVSPNFKKRAILFEKTAEENTPT